MLNHLRLIIVGAAMVALIAACSSGAGSPSAAAPSAAPPSVAAPSAAAPTEAAAPSESLTSEPDPAATVNVAESSLGSILVDADGRTLYLFTPDSAGEPTCYDACAQSWPPLIAEGDVIGGTGADQGLISTVARTDGSMQVKYGDWPLYYFASDAAAGDTNGQGLNDVWFVVSPAGDAIQ